ncbi:PP2C family serine/threonine-protein phosphatase [Thiospirillum jenense]|uniref:Protein phosphatase 2C domain-containing protein n=1 Tax=Thiospirillum jenense TaxID=1653858 RepID=A0A839HBR2_9GAMM|nr:PP2C family serine/threonine-protein phosphatase [Thiospirillum jenense]MBB1126435.1 protein phosphatase 2C domain-containing protein [Thiospirillum jenense]
MTQLNPPPPTLQVRFQLPNGKLGVPYQAVITGQLNSGASVDILSMTLPSELGLNFNADTNELHGIPTQSGDYTVTINWQINAQQSYCSDCLFIINPDPKQLWKILEPAPTEPYAKPHQAHQFLPNDTVNLLAASTRGRAHAHIGQFRDDDYFINYHPASGWSVLLVADGAGSAKFSREGAKRAVKTAGEYLIMTLASDLATPLETVLNNWQEQAIDDTQLLITQSQPYCHLLFNTAVIRAIESLEQAAQEQHANVNDYATTLLTAIVKRHAHGTFIATCWIGDGAIAAYDAAGIVSLLSIPDSGEFAGQTRFLARTMLINSALSDRIRIGYYSNLTALILMTDGLSDPRFETDNELRDVRHWDELWNELVPLLDTPNPSQALIDWLDFFSPGHHDDRTLALLW